MWRREKKKKRKKTQGGKEEHEVYVWITPEKKKVRAFRLKKNREADPWC